MLRLAREFVRWWFGLTYVIAGPAGMVWGVVVLPQGDAGGVYLFIGGFEILIVGWLIHPWGLQRGTQADAFPSHRARGCLVVASPAGIARSTPCR